MRMLTFVALVVAAASAALPTNSSDHVPVFETEVPGGEEVAAPGADPSEVDTWVKTYTRKSRCVVFGFTNCPACVTAKNMLSSKQAKHKFFGVYQENPGHNPSGMDVYKSLVRMTKLTTVPNIWIGGKFIGGADTLSSLNSAGKLDKMLKDAKCTYCEFGSKFPSTAG